MSTRPAMSPRHPHRIDPARAASGMGADSAFEQMIRSRPFVHRPGAPQSPPGRGLLERRRHLG